MTGHTFSFQKNSWVRCTSLCGLQRIFGSQSESKEVGRPHHVTTALSSRISHAIDPIRYRSLNFLYDTIMAYNPDAVSSMYPGIRLFYATSSPFLAATTPSAVATRLMHSSTFSVPRHSSVCFNKEPSIKPQNSRPV